MDNNFEQLTNAYGAWNPQTYLKAQTLADIAGQNAQEGAYQQQQKTAQDYLTTEKRGLANQFDAQNNPLRLENARLTNQGLSNAIDITGVNARIAQANEGFTLDADKQRKLATASDDQIKMMENQAQQMLYSLDPAQQDRGRKLMALSKTAIELRQKHADAMELSKLQRDSAERIARGNNATSIEVANIGANSRQAVAATRASQKSPQEIASKLGYEKGATYYQIKAEESSDPDEKAQYLEMAKRFEMANLRARSAGAIGRPDVSALGIEANKPEPALGTAGPKLGTAENPIVLK